MRARGAGGTAFPRRSARRARRHPRTPRGRRPGRRGGNSSPPAPFRRRGAAASASGSPRTSEGTQSRCAPHPPPPFHPPLAMSPGRRRRGEGKELCCPSSSARSLCTLFYEDEYLPVTEPCLCSGLCPSMHVLRLGFPLHSWTRIPPYCLFSFSLSVLLRALRPTVRGVAVEAALRIPLAAGAVPRPGQAGLRLGGGRGPRRPPHPGGGSSTSSECGPHEWLIIDAFRVEWTGGLPGLVGLLFMTVLVWPMLPPKARDCPREARAGPGRAEGGGCGSRLLMAAISCAVGATFWLFCARSSLAGDA